MILFTDPICSMYKEEHLNFNKKIVSFFDTHESAYYWSGDGLYGAALFGTKPVHLDSLSYNEKYNFQEALRRYFHIFRTIKKRKEADTVVFLSFDNTLFPLFCFLFGAIISKRRVICVIHNNIKTLKESIIKRSIFKRLNMVTTIDYVVLTKSMKFYADPLLRTSTTLLRHPFYEVTGERRNSNIRTFLAVGRQAVGLYENGFYDDFLSVSRSYLETHGGKIKLIIIFPGDSNLHSFISDTLEIQVISGFISSTVYDENFLKADFVVFPDTEEAEFRASGTLIDTLSSGATFIAPKRGYFREFEGCGLLYEKGEFKEAIEKALRQTEMEKEEMTLQAKEKKLEYESENHLTIKNLLSKHK